MQLKRCVSLFLAILLLISNVGLAFNVHYCGDKIASISSPFSRVKSSSVVDTPKKDCCCKKENSEKDTCCKNKVVDLKKNSKEIVIKNFSFQIQTPFILVKSKELTFAKAESISSNNVVSQYFCSPNAPPLFKLYQQYIFYA